VRFLLSLLVGVFGLLTEAFGLMILAGAIHAELLPAVRPLGYQGALLITLATIPLSCAVAFVYGVQKELHS
jgi:hypothetical protein